MKRDKNKKNEVKQKREPTSAEISMRAKEGEGAFTEDDDDATNMDDDHPSQRTSDRKDRQKK